MATFKDQDGREWHVNVTVGTVKRLRESSLGVNLAGIMDNEAELFKRLCEDIFFLVDVLYEVVRPEAEAIRVTETVSVVEASEDDPQRTVGREVTRLYGPEDFSRALGGNALYQAARALLDAITDFFPNAQTQKALRELIEKATKAGDAVANHLIQEIRAIDPKKVASEFLEEHQATKSTATAGSSEER